MIIPAHNDSMSTKSHFLCSNWIIIMIISIAKAINTTQILICFKLSTQNKIMIHNWKEVEYNADLYKLLWTNSLQLLFSKHQITFLTSTPCSVFSQLFYFFFSFSSIVFFLQITCLPPLLFLFYFSFLFPLLSVFKISRFHCRSWKFISCSGLFCSFFGLNLQREQWILGFYVSCFCSCFCFLFSFLFLWSNSLIIFALSPSGVSS